MQGLAVLIFVGWLISTPWAMVLVVGGVVAGLAVFAWVRTRQVLEFEPAASTWRRVEPRFEPWTAHEHRSERAGLRGRVEELERDLKDALEKVATLKARNERLDRDLQAARTAAANSRSDPLFRRVGLDEAAPDWVVTAVRTAYRKRLHPDVHPQRRKPEAERRYKEAEGVFDEILRVRDSER
jgi:hypothetical protein